MSGKNPIDEYLNMRDAIKNKKGQFSEEEFERIKNQTVTINGGQFANAVGNVATVIVLKEGLEGAMKFFRYSATLMHELFDKQEEEED